MPVNGFLVDNTVQKYNYESLENYNTPDFSTSSTYQVGDYVMYQGKLYKCTTAITTSGAWDSTKWSLAILSDDVADLKSAFVTPEMFGAVANDISSAGDNSTAFANAISSGREIRLGACTYYIDDTITNPNSIIGQGGKVSKIVMTDTSKPIIKFNTSKSLITLDSFGLSYSTYSAGSDTSLTNAIGIFVDSVTFGQSLLNELFITNVYYGIYATGEMYSDTFSNLWINHFSMDALHLHGSGTTGSVFSNIYISNWESYADKTRNRSRYGIFLQNYTECVLEQINVEHTISASAICLNSCESAVITDLHIEGFIPKDNYTGIVNNLGSHIQIFNFIVVFSGSNSDGYVSGATSATMVALFSLAYAKSVIICDVLSMRNNGWAFATTGKYYVYSNASVDETRRLTINNIKDSDNLISGSSGVSTNRRKSQVQRLGDVIYWESVGRDRVIKYLETLAPDSANLVGVFYTGDKFNVRECTNGVSDYCVTANGDYSTPTLTAKAYAEQYMGVVFLTNNNDGLKTKDRISINGKAYALTSNPYSSTAHSGYPYAVNISPNIAAGLGGENLDVNVAAPEVKGFAFV